MVGFHQWLVFIDGWFSFMIGGRGGREERRGEEERRVRSGMLRKTRTHTRVVVGKNLVKHEREAAGEGPQQKMSLGCPP